jgi:hypothetical protein
VPHPDPDHLVRLGRRRLARAPAGGWPGMRQWLGSQTSAAVL